MNPMLLLKIGAPVVIVALIFMGGYYKGKQVERAEWLERDNKELRELHSQLDEERQRLAAANDRVQELNRDLADAQGEAARLAIELQDKIDATDTITVAERQCEDDTVIVFPMPNIRADWWVHNCALDPSYCSEVSTSIDSGTSNDPLLTTDTVSTFSEGT